MSSARAELQRRYGLPLTKAYRLDFRVLPVTSHLTGNSLGIACAVGTVIAIARRETLRDSLALQPSVAFTGAVGADGSLAPIDGEGLRLKIERAYHNRLNYMAVPRAHLPEAYEAVRELEKQKPGHTLNVVGADTIDAILDDRNLVNRRRRSAAGFAATKTRTALNKPKVGLPILVSLLLILAIIGRPWLASQMDNNPATVEIKGKGILVKNQHGRTLWGKEYACDSLFKYADAWKVHDLDGDGHNEVLIEPPTSFPSPDNPKLFVYSSDGTLRFARDCAIWDQYPGDNVARICYQAGPLAVVQGSDGPVIVTLVSENNPSRAHVRTWTANGDSTGWYINAGVTYFRLARDFDGDGLKELFFTGYNVRMGASGLFVLRAAGSYGASPPFHDRQYDLSRVIPGNQLHYMIFPRTDLSDADLMPYNAALQLRSESDSSLRLDIAEGIDSTALSVVIYYLNTRLRVDRADISDEFRVYRQRAANEGRLSPVDWPQYLTHLRDMVTYWSSNGWVTEARLHSAE